MTREEEIQRRFRENDPLNLSAVQAEAPHLLEGLWEPGDFIGWRRTLEAAGVAVDAVRIHMATEVRCVLCEWSDVRLMRHYQNVHSMNIAEVRTEHPDAEELSEECRAAARLTKLGRGFKGSGTLVPHWEPAWSMRYAQDRLRWLHDAGIPVNYSHVAYNESGLAAYIRRVFGTWDRGLESVGLDPAALRRTAPSRQLSREKLLEFLRRCGKKTPEDLHIRRARSAKMKTLFAGFLREFGSYEAALTAAGLHPPDFIPRLKDPAWLARREALLAAARERVRTRPAYDVRVLAAFFSDHEDTVHEMFGQWAGIASALGCQERDLFPSLPFTGYRSETAVITAIKERKAAGLPVKEEIVRLDNVALITQSMRYFGSWSRALKAAGVTRPPRMVKQRHFPTPDGLLDSLRAVAAEGHSLRYLDVLKLPGHQVSGKWAHRYFGSWSAALVAAGLEPPERKAPRPFSRKKTGPLRFKTRQDFIDALQDRVRQGLSVENKDMNKQQEDGGDSTLLMQAGKEFGTYAAALKAAGLHRHFERPFFTKAEITPQLRRLHKNGVPMSRASIIASKDPGARFLIRSILSRYAEAPAALPAAVAAAGLPPLEGRGGQSRYPDAASVIEEIHRRRHAGLHPEIGSPFESREGKLLYKGACTFFGTWVKAVQAAGLVPKPDPRWKNKPPRAWAGG